MNATPRPELPREPLRVEPGASLHLDAAGRDAVAQWCLRQGPAGTAEPASATESAWS